MLYPPTGLPTLIVGPTGAGKSRLAEAMYLYAQHSGRLSPSAPYSVFNCADYASNPQLLLAQLFGYVKGAFTGADRDSKGLVAETDGGVLFLDEVHRLPPEGQEILFLLMDRGVYRPMGDAAAARRVSLTLIAATSEDPQSTLLRTFLRRFPMVITLPDLDSRPLDERLALIELFLREEASRVGLSISVSSLALVALLAFPTSGNVGELRSAVLLGCARAFLNHIATGSGAPVMPLYITHLAPPIQLAYLSGGASTGQVERLVGVEDRVYSPISIGRSSPPSRDDYVPADIYADLRRRVDGYLKSGLQPREVQQLIQTDMDHYLLHLVKRSKDIQLVPKGLLDAVAAFVSDAGAGLGRRFGQDVATGLSLHLASLPANDSYDLEGSMALVAHCPREYGVVLRLVPSLEAGLGRSLSPGEIAFLAAFLSTHGLDPKPGGLSVLVIAHGSSTASSMASVANRLLGNGRVLAVDMPLEQSVEETLQLAIRTISSTSPSNGVALLVDMGSLTGLGPALEKALGVPVAMIPLVTTVAVIEAGRLAGEVGANLAEVVRAIRRIYQQDDPDPVTRDGKRVIITTCLTGQGTARKLAAFLHEALPQGLREQVTVQAVDLENGSRLPGLLVEGWRGTVVAAAGTVDPHLPGVTFI
ncbi:MAG: sigma 54-interacting transcriptional regulator, partial [Firmicutes bacterium]|nr:sigma 54-interacting transcriptional regulator [Bacillota bacterium]